MSLLVNLDIFFMFVPQFILRKNDFIFVTSSGYSNLKTAQKMFNVDNGQRIHQRGGMKDGIIYNMTLLLIDVGGVVWANTVYTMAFPKK